MFKDYDEQLCRDNWVNSASVLGAGRPQQCISVSRFLYPVFLVFWTSSAWAWVEWSACFLALMKRYSQLAVVCSDSKTSVSKIPQVFNWTEYRRGFMGLSHLNRTGFRRYHCSLSHSSSEGCGLRSRAAFKYTLNFMGSPVKASECNGTDHMLS